MKPQPRGVSRLPSWILSKVLPRRHVEFVLGDMEEDFQRIWSQAGESHARRWYWRRTFSCLIALRPWTDRPPKHPRARNRRWIVMISRRRFDSAFGTTATVIGVADRSPYPFDADLWVPFRPSREKIERRSTGHELFVMGRLREGVEMRQAEQELRTIAIWTRSSASAATASP